MTGGIGEIIPEGHANLQQFLKPFVLFNRVVEKLRVALVGPFLHFVK